MTLNPISIATIGYVCDSVINPIARGTHGYICFAGVVPPTPDRRDGDGGHGAFIQYPATESPIVKPKSEDEQLALLAMLAIEEWYE